MGEVIHISEYLDRKAAEVDPADIRARIVEIGRAILILQSEKNQLLRQLPPPPDNPGA